MKIRREILKEAILDFWKDSGKEWCYQKMTNEDMKTHSGFKLCLDDRVTQALSQLEQLDLSVEEIEKEIQNKMCEDGIKFVLPYDMDFREYCKRLATTIHKRIKEGKC